MTVNSGQMVLDHCHACAHFSPFPMTMVEGADHVVRYINPAFCRLVGRTEDALLGSPIASCLPHSDDCLSVLTRVKRTSAPESHSEQRTAGPHPVYWSYSAWPVLVEGDRVYGVVLQITETSEFHRNAIAMNEELILSGVRQHELAEAADTLAVQMRGEMAERKKSGEALIASESRLSLALESARATTWEWNVVTNRLKWSGSSGELLPELESGSREVSYAAWRSNIHPDDRAAVDSVIQQASSSSPRINSEFRIQHRDGSISWMLLRGRPDRIEEGCATAYSGIAIDITERKYAEEVLLRSEKLASVGRLAATLAHEINNPLDAAMNALYLAQTAPELPEIARAYLEMADDELRRVAHMARQSLGFYREMITPSTFTVDALLGSVLGLLKSRFLGKSITVLQQAQENLSLTGIFGELRQVLVNLLANSVDALDSGGIIKLRTSLDLPLNGEAQRIRITVADNGRGIDPQQRLRIFEPFFTTKGELGTGLGLWVTKQIVEKHGGTIQVRSTTDRTHSGTVFSITLPNGADGKPSSEHNFATP